MNRLQGGWPVGEWKQGKCGWPTDTGPCKNRTKKGTSRCWMHQGAWTAYDIQRRAAAAKRKSGKPRKK